MDDKRQVWFYADDPQTVEAFCRAEVCMTKTLHRPCILVSDRGVEAGMRCAYCGKTTVGVGAWETVLQSNRDVGSVGSEKDCAFCQTPLEPAPTDDGWIQFGHNGMHMRCIKKLHDVCLAVEQAPELKMVSRKGEK